MMNDPGQRLFIYRQNPTTGGTNDLLDWASHLLAFMGNRNLAGSDFNSAPAAQSRVFVCPSDPVAQAWDGPASPGYTLFNNVVTATQRISYAYNVDVGANVDLTTGEGRFGLSDNMLVYREDSNGAGVITLRAGAPINGKLNKIRNTSSTMLFADGGTFPSSGSGAVLDRPQVLAYTTNYIHYNTDPSVSGANTFLKFTLAGVARTSWLNSRIPLDRHGKRDSSIRNNNPLTSQKVKGGRINVAFADGRAESVGWDGFKNVNISPYAPK
jgi:prepilin-type processing-associated H-X9-DG protein